MNVEYSQRIKNLPPYLFIEIDNAKKAARAKGADLIDLGIGDPDSPTPQVIIDALNKVIKDPSTHRYPLGDGHILFRQEIAKWYKKRFNVEVDAQTEIVALIGSKEGIAHLPFAFIDKDDVVLVPDPGYPVYRSATNFAGGQIHVMPLKEKNGFLPVLSDIPEEIRKKAKLMFLNYPNNPTAAVATKEFFQEVVTFAKKYNIIVCHDAAYTEVFFEGHKPLSFLEIEGAKEVCVEMHSLSKTCNMTGWRVGFAVGNADIVKGLSKIKGNTDSGVFTAIQMAGVKALQEVDMITKEMNAKYEARRNTLVKGLKSLGVEVSAPKATFYVWVKNFAGYDSITLAKKILNEAEVVVTPGNGFGEYGEGYIRFALTVDCPR
ncbi:MAG: LL-diaminopimelate aminotransferase, partial [Candidatus Omnitrophica bacterium]|nr:LL-diaminopimelate aminotransferase [Candidatus Omnitrophota bacterium]